jgi:NifU-like protein involved in Fe-S cluster formation
MSKEDIEQLYKKWIIPESKNPYHFEKKEGTSVLAYNPVCGDKYKIFPDKPPFFHGIGCALSKASGSLLMGKLEQLKPSESIPFIKAFINSVRSGKVDQSLDENLRTLVMLKEYDGREECILLIWKAYLEYLESPHT